MQVQDEQEPVTDDIPSNPAAEAGVEPEGVDEEETQEAPPPLPRIDPLLAVLRAELAAKDEQLRGYITAYKQATADMERERQRMAKERGQVADAERMALAESLLDVLDNFDRSLAGCREGASLEDVAAGLRLVRDQFGVAMGDLGVKRIDAVGAAFDASLHEATGLIPASGDQVDQQIVFEERPGYTFKGKLLRASRVVVASKP